MDILMHLGVITMAYNIKMVNPKVDMAKALTMSETIEHYANVFNLDANLIAAVISVESRFKEGATGGAGEVGLMQLHPKFHVTGYDIQSNIGAGVEYLATLKSMFGDKYEGLLWVEHYNRGPNCKPRAFSYAKRVREFYDSFRGVKSESKGQARPVQLSKRRSKEYRRVSGPTTKLYIRRQRKPKVYAQKHEG